MREKKFLLSLVFICVFCTLSAEPPQTYLIAPSVMLDPPCCHVELCFCFVDVMTIASTLLMMWWDWPSAKQRSGTDEKTWLTDFLLFSGGASVYVCVRLGVGCCIITDSAEIHSRRFSSQDLLSDIYVFPMVPILRNLKSMFVASLMDLQALHLLMVHELHGFFARSQVWVMFLEEKCVYAHLWVWHLPYLDQ